MILYFKIRKKDLERILHNLQSSSRKKIFSTKEIDDLLLAQRIIKRVLEEFPEIDEEELIPLCEKKYVSFIDLFEKIPEQEQFIRVVN